MKEYVFGVDLGGTTCKLGLFRKSGELMEKWEIPTDTSEKGANILKDIAASIHKKMVDLSMTKDMIEGIGMGVPGPVSVDGVVNRCVNLGWEVMPVAASLEELSGLKVKVGNDANMAALGESWKGSGADFSSIVMVTLGTGIGGGIVIDGKVLNGATGAAGEIGHIIVNEQELESCGCGQYGCIEQYASATGIARLARKKLSTTAEKSMLRKNPIDKISAKSVFDAAKKEDALAVEIIQEICKLLAAALCKISVVVNPQAFVIGGGVSRAGKILQHTLEEAYYNQVFHACKETKIVLASLGNDAGIYGSAKLMLEDE